MFVQMVRFTKFTEYNVTYESRDMCLYCRSFKDINIIQVIKYQGWKLLFEVVFTDACTYDDGGTSGTKKHAQVESKDPISLSGNLIILFV